MEQYPNLQSLANANIQELLEQWRPLGLPRRALLLHQLAKTIVSDYKGQFPESEDKLRDLPGIGPYGAAAIACLAFGQRAPMIDINVTRILHRVFSVEYKPRSKPSSKLRNLTLELMPHGKEREFNLAMLDLGAEICRPHNPLCAICPLASICDYNLTFGLTSVE
jgi:A/G-specific adenine glycosylase